MYRFALVTSIDLLSTAINDCPGWGANYPDVFSAIYVASAEVQEMDLTWFEGRVVPEGIVFVVGSRPLSTVQYETLSRIGLGSIEIVPDRETPVIHTPTGYRVGLPSSKIRDLIHARGYLYACWGGSVWLPDELAMFRDMDVVSFISGTADDPPLIKGSDGLEISGMLMIDDQWSVADFEAATKRVRCRVGSGVPVKVGFSSRFPESAGSLCLVVVRKSRSLS